ncbi:MAG: MotA/TolQ/ExbB proton channel family protein [Bacteroidales bacterium]|nr:MotA/TolQ/ExbB proton channel family protein [Bacteroidales bacterium]MBO7378585.1 MotA/TolQ/ExbB proton channel family protein [Bacteroidales bacterium]MBP5214332.1 MotA/TolQ/ExbB proton channel family protein [Bacteroidales bacterium]MBP5764599.1 MotA/TolQ/ExbB proton channel family protein [Bacteroidales bacterium]
MMTLSFLQITMPGAADTLAQVSEVTGETAADEGLSFLDMAVNGGWLMIPLLLLSLLAIYIFVERLVVIRKALKDAPYFMERIREYLADGKTDAAIRVCKQTKSPYAAMIEKGILRMGHSSADIQAAIENVGNLQVANMEKGFTMMATISAGAPMIGFLGTVTGMIRAFYDMAQAGSSADITLLSAGIYQALTTTVAGLIVGIFAMFAYNYLVAELDKVVNQMEAKTMEFMDLIAK